jgi:hypothetical protein
MVFRPSFLVSVIDRMTSVMPVMMSAFVKDKDAALLGNYLPLLEPGLAFFPARGYWNKAGDTGPRMN